MIFGFLVSKGEISGQEADMIQTVAILGAGAVGGYFVWGLSEKLGENLWVIAKGERKERLEREGLTINGKIFHFPVKTPEEAAGADVLLVATKYGTRLKPVSQEEPHVAYRIEPAKRGGQRRNHRGENRQGAYAVLDYENRIGKAWEGNPV